ncbi:DUF4595 domain-containing protein [Arcticibacter tournemirensis]|uniref:DUF4595 domain-containing protein n=1 Tax=Arcticibacter tournemirensis TaxID=699437 RepID=A0A4Q0M8V7_9SPHI|nr:DUF4595 domain-containing protein [Arcticibacter tournemirensis]RXF69373.1 DUF4595 domain-containing protein [Arcticibacter tournemirensis]
MIKKSTLIYLISAAAFLFACSKEEGSDKPDEKCLVSGIEQTDSIGKNTQTYSFEYDDQNRMIQANATRDTAFKSFDFQFSPGKLIMKSRFGGTIDFTLDEQGRISSYTGADPNKTTVFKYNQEGYLIEIVATYNFTRSDGTVGQPSVHTSKLTYTNGNLTKISGKWNSSSIVELTTFEYNNEEANTLFGINAQLDQFTYNYTLPGYYGKTSKNELVKATQTNESENAPVNIITFQYEKDPSGKIRSIVSVFKNIFKSPGKPDKISTFYRNRFTIKYTCD